MCIRDRTDAGQSSRSAQRGRIWRLPRPYAKAVMRPSSDICKKGISLESVSYTHLDVYKRQALLVLMEWGRLDALIPVIILAREFIISGFRILAAAEGVVIAAGPVGKVKTAVQMVGIALILLENPIFSMWGIDAGSILLYISAALAIWSCIEYIYKNRQLLRG